MSRKNVLITGGATGIGRQIAESLAREGHVLFINYRKSKEKAEAFAEEIKRKYAVPARAIGGDVARKEDCVELYKEITASVPGIDILIHNAGPYIHERKDMVQYEFAEWEYIINGNLNGVFYLSKLVLPYMRRQKWGRIITFGFDRAETAPGWRHRSAFAAAKSGLVSLTKTMSMEEAPYGITVNMVAPGDIVPPWKEKPIAAARKLKDPDTPVGRPGTGEDIARVVAFLCQEDSSFLTGTVIHVTGGKDVLGKRSER